MSTTDPISINENVRVFAVYRRRLGGNQGEFETAVQQFYPAERIVFPFDNTNGHFTGIALNTDPFSILNILIRDEKGDTLWAGNPAAVFRFHGAFLLQDEFPITHGIRGTIQFTLSTSAAPVLSAVALRFSPAGPFTSLAPVYQGASSGGFPQ